jgi:hypothetical protein
LKSRTGERKVDAPRRRRLRFICDQTHPDSLSTGDRRSEIGEPEAGSW